MQVPNYFEMLPDEIQLHIFSLLDEKSNCRSSRVCKAWEKKSQMDDVWKCIFPGIEKLASKGCKMFIKDKNLKKIDSILELMPLFESFCIRLESIQRGVFNCLFPHNPGSLATITLHSESTDGTSSCIEETYLLTTPLDADADRSGLMTTIKDSGYNIETNFTYPCSEHSFDVFNDLSTMGLKLRCMHTLWV